MPSDDLTVTAPAPISSLAVVVVVACCLALAGILLSRTRHNNHQAWPLYGQYYSNNNINSDNDKAQGSSSSVSWAQQRELSSLSILQVTATPTSIRANIRSGVILQLPAFEDYCKDHYFFQVVNSQKP